MGILRPRRSGRRTRHAGRGSAGDAARARPPRPTNISRLTRSVGIDVGGTFTDLAAVDENGRVDTRKTLSTVWDHSVGVEHALRALGDTGGETGGDIARIVHGTTVATNTLLERSGARVVLCATDGFTDVLWLRRQTRSSLYDLTRDHDPPLVRPENVVGLPERTGARGVVHALDDTAADACARRVASLEPDIVAVALLHAYADRRHEDKLRDALRRVLPANVSVVCSSDVYPEIREYERTATTVAEAYLRPAVARYVRRLDERLSVIGAPALGVMTSNGGMRHASDAAQMAASLALSGPAGGVVGAAAVATTAGVKQALTIDIGGTSADVGLVLDGRPLVEPGGEVAGVPLSLPRVLVETVSAGGGSIAWVDAGGALRVGPRSAGAAPGPAAFGRGGTLPTVTDAHVVLGHITASRFSGEISVDRSAAVTALLPIARALGSPLDRAAAAVIATADATMARALRRLSVERGVDPRSCVLIAFGGGGPLHACGLADRVGMTRILVPPHAGVLSALGLAVVAERRESMESVMQLADDIDPASLRALLRRLASAVDGPYASSREWWLRCRYVGQGHEIDVPVREGGEGASVTSDFASLHARRYGFVLDRAVEVVSARCAVSGDPRPLWLSRTYGRSADWTSAQRVDLGGSLDVTLAGPTTVVLADATLFIGEGWVGRSLEIGGWMLERRVSA